MQNDGTSFEDKVAILKETFDSLMAGRNIEQNYIALGNIINECSSIFDKDLSRKLNEIRSLNILSRDLEKYLIYLGEKKSSLDPQKKDASMNDLGAFTNSDGQTFSVETWMRDNGIKVIREKEDKWLRAEIQKLIDSINAVLVSTIDQTNIVQASIHALSTDYEKVMGKIREYHGKLKGRAHSVILNMT